MSNAVARVSMTELEKMAAVIVKSELFGVKDASQAITLMLLAQAEGVHPAIAMRDYHIVEGKPALKADAMLARFQAAGGKIEWEDYTDTKVSARFSHPNSPKPVLIEWSIELANKVTVYNKKRGGWEPITSKYNWKAYPRQMLKARVISEGIRATFPGVAVGIYTPEEVQDFGPEKDVTPKSVTAGFLQSQPAKRQEVIIETADEIKAFMANGQAADAYALWQNSKFDAEEEIALWSLLPSDYRSMLKRMEESEKAQQAGTITPAMKKRLEARIKEFGLDREKMKASMFEQFGKEHFSELTRDEYNVIDAQLSVPPLPSIPPPPPVADEAPGGADHETAAAQVDCDTSLESGLQPEPAPATAHTLQSLETALEYAPKVTRNRLIAKLATKGVKSLTDLTPDKIPPLIKWVEEQIDKEAAKAKATA